MSETIQEKKMTKNRRRRINKKQKLTPDELQFLLSDTTYDDKLIVQEVQMSRLPTSSTADQEIYQIEAKIKKTPEAPEENLHLVAKMVPSWNPNVTRTAKETDLALYREREMFFYDTISRWYELFEEEFNIKDDAKYRLIPKFYGYRYSRDETSNDVDSTGLLLLENLKVAGFYGVENFNDLDMEHARVGIKALARFHTLGMLVKQEVDDGISLDIDDFNINVIDIEGLTKTLLSDSYLRKYALKIKSQVLDYYTRYNTNDVDTAMLTIAHGNFATTKNMLFHKDANGEVDGVTFVDFQDYLLASPFRDVCAFMFSCLRTDILQKRIDELLDLYYEEYTRLVNKLQVAIGPFSRGTFDEKLQQAAILEFPVCVFLYDKDLDRLRKLVRLYLYKKWFRF